MCHHLAVIGRWSTATLTTLVDLLKCDAVGRIGPTKRPTGQGQRIQWGERHAERRVGGWPFQGDSLTDELMDTAPVESAGTLDERAARDTAVAEGESIKIAGVDQRTIDPGRRKDPGPAHRIWCSREFGDGDSEGSIGQRQHTLHPGVADTRAFKRPAGECENQSICASLAVDLADSKGVTRRSCVRETSDPLGSIAEDKHQGLEGNAWRLRHRS